jgi:hypothetical protein
VTSFEYGCFLLTALLILNKLLVLFSSEYYSSNRAKKKPLRFSYPKYNFNQHKELKIKKSNE